MITAMTIRDSPSTGRGGVWEYLSPSRLNCWLSCPLKFKLTYIDGIRAPTTPSLFLGKVVHASLECFYRNRQLGIALDADYLKQRMLQEWGAILDEERFRFDEPAEEQAAQRQAIDLVTAYLRQMPANEPRPLAVEAAVEAPLVDPTTGEALGLPLLGVMDLVLDGPEGSTIVDFKTTSRSSEPLEIVHEIQLTSYAWLFRHAQGGQEAALEIRSLVKTKTPKVENHRYPPRTDVHFRRLFAVVRGYLDDLDANRFVFRPGFGCGMCEHRDKHCRSWAG